MLVKLSELVHEARTYVFNVAWRADGPGLFTIELNERVYTIKARSHEEAAFWVDVRELVALLSHLLVSPQKQLINIVYFFVS